MQRALHARIELRDDAPNIVPPVAVSSETSPARAPPFRRDVCPPRRHRTSPPRDRVLGHAVVWYGPPPMTAPTFRVLVSDKLAPDGLLVLKKAAPRITFDVQVGLPPAALLSVIGQYDGLAIRSATKVTAEVLAATERLKVIGRAGIGVDNVDLEAATKRGIVVMNTPEGNADTTAEHALALMFAMARKVPQATASMRAGKWEKSSFQGRELTGKTLGIVGLGNIGKIVADRGRGLRMKVIASDPFVTPERAQKMGVELVGFDTLLERADFVTLHVPLTTSTQGMIGRSALEKMKPGAFLINAARGGLVDELAALAAVESGRLGGAAFDVFETEPPPADHPLLGANNVVVTPHLGASTREAQANVSVAVAEQIVGFLLEGTTRNAVNTPAISSELRSSVAPYLRLGDVMGLLAGQLHSGGVQEVRARYAGETAELPTDPVTAALLSGLLRSALGGQVNPVNAPLIARERGIEVVEEKTSRAHDFRTAVTLRVLGELGGTEIVGALFGDEQRIVGVNGFRSEIVPEGNLIMTRHHDRPGIIGKMGTILGERQVNISRMTLGRRPEGGDLAQAFVSVDARVTAETLQEIAAIDGIETVRRLELG